MIQEYKRVLQVTTKPTKTEYKRTIIITSIGVLLIGLIGFTITIITQMMR